MRTLYVTATDGFMSGWGRAEGRINRLVFICETAEDVEAVYDNCMNREEFKHVNICQNEPHYSPKTHLMQFKTKQDMPNFFKPGSF